jgi:hypothetical protein
VPNAGLVVPATLMARLGLEALINSTLRLVGRVGGALPGRKVLTLVVTILAGGSHIDHADMLRAGATQRVLGFRVMAPSTLGTFLRSFTFGHVRQLDRVAGEALRRAWRLDAGPGDDAVTIDLILCGAHGRCRSIARADAKAPSSVRTCAPRAAARSSNDGSERMRCKAGASLR